MRTVATNAIEPASSTSASFGFIPIPGKGGKTTNSEILRNKVDKDDDLLYNKGVLKIATKLQRRF